MLQFSPPRLFFLLCVFGVYNFEQIVSTKKTRPTSLKFRPKPSKKAALNGRLLVTLRLKTINK